MNMLGILQYKTSSAFVLIFWKGISSLIWGTDVPLAIICYVLDQMTHRVIITPTTLFSLIMTAWGEQVVALAAIEIVYVCSITESHLGKVTNTSENLKTTKFSK